MIIILWTTAVVGSENYYFWRNTKIGGTIISIYAHFYDGHRSLYLRNMHRSKTRNMFALTQIDYGGIAGASAIYLGQSKHISSFGGLGIIAFFGRAFCSLTSVIHGMLGVFLVAKHISTLEKEVYDL